VVKASPPRTNSPPPPYTPHGAFRLPQIGRLWYTLLLAARGTRWSVARFLLRAGFRLDHALRLHAES